MNILIIGKVWPEPNSSAAGKRMLQLIELLNGLGKVHFYCSASKSGFESDLISLNVSEKHIELNNDLFDLEIQQLNPQIVVFDRFMTEEQFGWRVIESCPKALRILNTEDLHFLRKARGEVMKRKSENQSENESENERERESEVNFDNNDTMRELAAIYRCDLSLLVSEFEIDLLKNLFQIPKHLLYYLPIFVEDNAKIEVSNNPSFGDRKDLIFIGNFLHEPNVDAVKFLKNEIWPALRLLHKDINLHIYGAYPTQYIKELSNVNDGFIVHGRALNAKEEVSKARLTIAPLRFGAGIKGKLLESMQCGTPTISSEIGIEGIASENDWPGAVCTTAKEYANAISKLYGSESGWLEAQKKGYKILQNKFRSEIYVDEFQKTIMDLMNNLATHRNQSFTRKIFLHQSMMSTKYLSKWIMEKNNSLASLSNRSQSSD